MPRDEIGMTWMRFRIISIFPTKVSTPAIHPGQFMRDKTGNQVPGYCDLRDYTGEISPRVVGVSLSNSGLMGYATKPASFDRLLAPAKMAANETLPIYQALI